MWCRPGTVWTAPIRTRTLWLRLEMKKCETCDPSGIGENRVVIGKNHGQIPYATRILGVFLIYLPILTLPFVMISAYVSYFHLKLMGAENIKTLKDFLPDRASFRYKLSNQIVMRPGYRLSPTQSRLFWVLNCTWYCPFSVGLFEWHAYLVKLVENWWCPFFHGRKEGHYQEGAIDRSFWHIFPEDVVKLDPEDRDNPIWNEDVKGVPEH
nr:hypothetical protein [Methylococcus capsulatus]